jgi:hypothetical protein
MSISMERFGSEGQFATYNPFEASVQAVAIFQIQCRCCGFEPEGVLTIPRLCPKCHSNSWERYAKPGSILENANRY